MLRGGSAESHLKISISMIKAFMFILHKKDKSMHLGVKIWKNKSTSLLSMQSFVSRIRLFVIEKVMSHIKNHLIWNNFSLNWQELANESEKNLIEIKVWSIPTKRPKSCNFSSTNNERKWWILRARNIYINNQEEVTMAYVCCPKEPSRFFVVVETININQTALVRIL